MKENLLRKIVNEIIDSNGDIIGKEDMPDNDGNMDSMANTTSDKTQMVGHQSYRSNYAGLLGFSVMEDKEKDDSNVIEEDKISDEKSDDKSINKEKSTGNDVLDKKLKDIADVLNKKFDKTQLNKLVNLLEVNRPLANEVRGLNRKV